MNLISSWLCTNNSKNLFVKIVHPGGHVELHDRPILASELLNRNPKCCVAHPIVFQQPYAIVSPDTTLVLGQKYYVVPLGTIRKLQLKYPRVREAVDQQNSGVKKDDDSSVCWLFRCNNKNDEKSVGTKIMGGSIESLSEETITESMKKASEDSYARVGHGGPSSSSSSSTSPGRISLVSIDSWQPGLKSITEE